MAKMRPHVDQVQSIEEFETNYPDAIPICHLLNTTSGVIIWKFYFLKDDNAIYQLCWSYSNGLLKYNYFCNWTKNSMKQMQNKYDNARDSRFEWIMDLD